MKGRKDVSRRTNRVLDADSFLFFVGVKVLRASIKDRLFLKKNAQRRLLNCSSKTSAAVLGDVCPLVAPPQTRLAVGRTLVAASPCQAADVKPRPSFRLLAGFPDVNTVSGLSRYDEQWHFHTSRVALAVMLVFRVVSSFWPCSSSSRSCGES